MKYKDFEKPRKKISPLYVCRPVLNTGDIITWAKSQGMESMLCGDELHVTICYSKDALDWDKPGKTSETIRVKATSEFPKDKPIRQMEMFGKEHNILVLQLESDDLTKRWQRFIDCGASYDFDEYKPHITITYSAKDINEDDLAMIEPYQGEIVLGPEVFKAIDDEFAGNAEEIDLTKPLDELIDDIDDTAASEVSEAYLNFIGVQDVLREQIEYARGHKVFVNPSHDQVMALADASELRGVTDDKDVFVWNAYGLTHMDVMFELGIPTEYYKNRFYAWIPEFGADAGDWENREASWLDARDSHRVAGADGLMVSVKGTEWTRLQKHRGFMRMLGQRAVSESTGIINSDGHRFFRNPSVGTVQRLLAKAYDDLRGISDGIDVYVWDGYACTHNEACSNLGLNYATYLKSSFYVRSDHADDEDELEIPGPGYFIHLDPYPDIINKMMAIPNFAYITGQPKTLKEGLETSLRYFWLITRLQGRPDDSEPIKARHESILRDLATGTLHGLRGISSSREIITEFLDISGNVCLQMPADDVMRLNDIEQIRYDDPEYLTKDNMAALYRLWEKDRSKMGRYSFMTQLLGFVIREIKQQNSYLGNLLDYDTGSIIRSYQDNERLVANSPKEVAAMIHSLFLQYCKDKPSYRNRDIEEMPPSVVYEATVSAINYIGSLYVSESEWVINSDVFHVPESSTMLVSANTEVMAQMKQLDLSSPDADAKYKAMVGWGGSDKFFTYQNLKLLLNDIKNYDLAQKYRLRFISSQKFQAIRDRVKTKRRTKK